MNIIIRTTLIGLCSVLAAVPGAKAQNWNVVTGDFRIDGNWDTLSAPGAGATAYINNGGTATIGAGPLLDVGNLMMGGDGSGSANLTGNLIINGGTNSISTSLNSDSFVGNFANNLATVGWTTLTMNGGTLMVDDPNGALTGKYGFSSNFDFAGATTNSWWSTAGYNNKALVVGSRTRGSLVLHNDARILAAKSVHLANNGGGTGQEATLLMDGTSMIAMGAGIEVGKLTATVSMTLADHAIFASGNSMGPGHPEGHTDQGYFTFGTRLDGNQTILVKDNAEIQCLTLQNRLGNSTLTLTNQGKLKVHNVLTGSGTIVSSQGTYVASQNPSATTIALRGNSLFLVDSVTANKGVLGTNGVNGLHIGGGQGLEGAYPGNPGSYDGLAGGVGVLDIRDSATLDIKQGLHLGMGTASTAAGTLRVEGPGPTVHIGWNLNLAVNEYREVLQPGTGFRPGTGAVHMVITTNTQAPIVVGGMARLTNGVLKLTLQGYTPPAGTRYTLIQAGAVDGAFKTVDLSAAPLPAGQSWYIQTTPTNVTASVWPPALSIRKAGNKVVVEWPGPGQLQSALTVDGTYNDISGATSPHTNSTTAGAVFFRLRQ